MNLNVCGSPSTGRRFTFEDLHEHTLGPEGGHASEQHLFNVEADKVTHCFGYDAPDCDDLSMDFDFDPFQVETREDALTFVGYELAQALERVKQLEELKTALETKEFVSTADYDDFNEEEDDFEDDEDFDEEE